MREVGVTSLVWQARRGQFWKEVQEPGSRGPPGLIRLPPPDTGCDALTSGCSLRTCLFEILNTFWTTGCTYSFCTGHHKLYLCSCLTLRELLWLGNRAIKELIGDMGTHTRPERTTLRKKAFFFFFFSATWWLSNNLAGIGTFLVSYLTLLAASLKKAKPSFPSCVSFPEAVW